MAAPHFTIRLQIESSPHAHCLVYPFLMRRCASMYGFGLLRESGNGAAWGKYLCMHLRDCCKLYKCLFRGMAHERRCNNGTTTSISSSVADWMAPVDKIIKLFKSQLICIYSNDDIQQPDITRWGFGCYWCCFQSLQRFVRKWRRRGTERGESDENRTFTLPCFASIVPQKSVVDGGVSVDRRWSCLNGCTVHWDIT